MKINKYLRSTTYSILLVLFVYFGYATIEPMVGRAITDDFVVTQTITSEISFSTTAADVTMSPSIAGVSGGTATGQTQFGVKTNDSSGYNVTIHASTNPAMTGNTQGDDIADYTPASAGTPDYAFSAPSGEEFGYTVSASTTADLDASFKDNASDTCGTGSDDTSGSATCWYGLSTTPETIVNRSSETAASGENSMVYFKTHVNSGAFLVEDTYTATLTLTAVTN